LWIGPAWADVEKCVQSHSQGQISRDEGQFLRSQAEFLACAADEACPAPVKEECQEYLTTVKALTPTVVFAARDTLGRDLDGVRVYLDGEFLADVDGSAPVPVDPGPHRMRFEHPSGQVVEQKIVAVQGEQARFVAAEFAVGLDAPSTTSHDVTTSSAPSDLRRISTYVFGGLAVVGLTSFAVFGLQGKSEEQKLRSSCAPNCTSAQKRSVAEKYLLADVSLAVAGLSLAGGAVLYLAPSPDAAGQSAAISIRGEF
jgi:hypothetical protein